MNCLIVNRYKISMTNNHRNNKYRISMRELLSFLVKKISTISIYKYAEGRAVAGLLAKKAILILLRSRALKTTPMYRYNNNNKYIYTYILYSTGLVAGLLPTYFILIKTTLKNFALSDLCH